MLNNRDCACFCTLVPSLGMMSSIGAGKLLIMTSWLFDACLFGASGLAARMTRLIIVHDRLVNKVCTIDELTLTSTAVLLVQKRDTVVHLNCSL